MVCKFSIFLIKTIKNVNISYLKSVIFLESFEVDNYKTVIQVLC